MRTGRMHRLLPAILVVPCLFLSGLVQNRLNQERHERGLTHLPVLDNAPPGLVITTQVLGGFRGIIANLIWIRASRMQDEGRYFEMVQLSDLITRLQPRFVTPWIHSAWNLSYNISVKFPDHQDRWKWVQHGIRLLRDEGIPNNPDEPLLYRELAWHFQHKMGDNMDDAHRTYKMEWARLMETFFEDGSPDFEALSRPGTPEGIERARELREDYKMDPAVIREVEENYGPLEWRLPETHSIYWAHRGLALSRREDQNMTLRRSIYQSMQKAFFRGRLVRYRVTPEDEIYETYPNLEITERVNQTYLRQMEEEPDLREHIGNGHKNFLRSAVYFLYTNNREDEAAHYFDYCRRLYPDSIGTSLEEYVFDRVEEEFGSTSQDRIKAVLTGFITESFRQLCIGNDGRAQGLDLLTRRIWERFHREIGEEQEIRVGLPTIPELKDTVLRTLLDPDASPFPPLLVDRLVTLLGDRALDLLPDPEPTDPEPAEE